MRKLVPLLILIGAVIQTQAQVNFTSNTVCFGASTILTAPDSTTLDSVITAWNWDLDNDGMYDDATGKILYHSFGASGSLIVGLETLSGMSGTRDSVSNAVIVNPVPIPNFKPENVCRLINTTYHSVSTIDTPHSISLYGWDFEDDGNPDGDGSDSASWTYTIAGPNNTRLTTTSVAGCTSSVVKSVQVFNEAVADFTVDGGTTFGDTTDFRSLSFVNGGEVIIMYAWNFGDDQTSSLKVPKHRYNSPGAFNVSLTVVTENFCQNTYSEKVTIIDFINEGGVTVINNVMTPNGDGINDFLLIDNLGSYNSCTIAVYNQWNQEVYTSPNYENLWDGTMDGDGSSELDPGTYFYVIQCDEKEKTVGSINILR